MQCGTRHRRATSRRFGDLEPAVHHDLWSMEESGIWYVDSVQEHCFVCVQYSLLYSIGPAVSVSLGFILKLRRASNSTLKARTKTNKNCPNNCSETVQCVLRRGRKRTPSLRVAVHALCVLCVHPPRLPLVCTPATATLRGNCTRALCVVRAAAA